MDEHNEISIPAFGQRLLFFWLIIEIKYSQRNINLFLFKLQIKVCFSFKKKRVTWDIDVRLRDFYKI